MLRRHAESMVPVPGQCWHGLIIALLLGVLNGCGSGSSQPPPAPLSPQQLWRAAGGDVLAFVNLLEHQVIDSMAGGRAEWRSAAQERVFAQGRYAAVLKEHASAPAAVLNALVYDSLQIQFDSSRTDVYNIFPHAVVQRKKGSCIGIALLYLTLARSSGVPLWGVLVPGHFFVQTTQGDTLIGMDVLKRGEHRSAGWYREKFCARDTSSLYLRALDDVQVGAVVAFNLANWYAQQGRSALAEQWYAWSCEQLPLHAACWGNRALNLSQLKRYDEAHQMLDRAESFGAAPNTVVHNRATLCGLQQHWHQAEVHYRRGLQRTPQDGELLYGLSYALYKQGKNDDARTALAQLLQRRPDHAQGGQLALLLQAGQF